MMHSLSGMFTKGKSDNYYTPKIFVEIILPYLEKYANQSKIILCPFDTQNSEFVLGIKEYFGESLRVEYSHIDTGKDFFTYTKDEVNKYCAIVSNPPFSKKLDVFKKLNEFKLPYAMVSSCMVFNYHEINNYFSNNPCQILFVDKRISFTGNWSSFSSCYICKGILSQDLIFEKIAHNNTNQYYVPSRMYRDFKLT